MSMGINHIYTLQLETEGEVIVVNIDYGNAPMASREKYREKTRAEMKEAFPRNKIVVIGT
jgi:hypothetical protein